MEKQQTLEDVANQVVKMTSYGLGYGSSMNTISQRVRVYLEEHVELRTPVPPQVSVDEARKSRKALNYLA